MKEVSSSVISIQIYEKYLNQIKELGMGYKFQSSLFAFTFGIFYSKILLRWVKKRMKDFISLWKKWKVGSSDIGISVYWTTGGWLIGLH